MYNITIISFKIITLHGSASAGPFYFMRKSALNCILVLQNVLYMLLYSCKVIKEIKEIKGDNRNGNRTNYERI